MKNEIAEIPTEYFDFHLGQVRAIGRDAQIALHNSRVLVVGTGRIGSAAAIGLNAAGVGELVLIDNQLIEPEQLGPSFYALGSNIGTPKAVALARFLSRRSAGTAQGKHLGIESMPLEHIRAFSLVICCANDINARLNAERKAILARVPIVQAASFDGREQLGGMITIKHPSLQNVACYGCLTSLEAPPLDRQDGLITSVTAVLGNLAADFGVRTLGNFRHTSLYEHNVFVFDLERCLTERLNVRRRTGCPVCELDAAA